MAQNSVINHLPSSPRPVSVSPLFTRRRQQRADIYCSGQWSVHVTDWCPSSALRPAGPACWVPESKDGDPWPARTNHPDLRCPRAQTPHSLGGEEASRLFYLILAHRCIRDHPHNYNIINITHSLTGKIYKFKLTSPKTGKNLKCIHVFMSPPLNPCFWNIFKM